MRTEITYLTPRNAAHKSTCQNISVLAWNDQTHRTDGWDESNMPTVPAQEPERATHLSQNPRAPLVKSSCPHQRSVMSTDCRLHVKVSRGDENQRQDSTHSDWTDESSVQLLPKVFISRSKTCKRSKRVTTTWEQKPCQNYMQEILCTLKQTEGGNGVSLFQNEMSQDRITSSMKQDNSSATTGATWGKQITSTQKHLMQWMRPMTMHSVCTVCARAIFT